MNKTNAFQIVTYPLELDICEKTIYNYIEKDIFHETHYCHGSTLDGDITFETNSLCFLFTTPPIALTEQSICPQSKNYPGNLA